MINSLSTLCSILSIWFQNLCWIPRDFFYVIIKNQKLIFTSKSPYLTLRILIKNIWYMLVKVWILCYHAWYTYFPTHQEASCYKCSKKTIFVIPFQASNERNGPLGVSSKEEKRVYSIFKVFWMVYTKIKKLKLTSKLQYNNIEKKGPNILDFKEHHLFAFLADSILHFWNDFIGIKLIFVIFCSIIWYFLLSIIWYLWRNLSWYMKIQ